MKKTINEYDFINEFMDSDRKNDFSFEALQALFIYYEELEADTGEEIELDIIAICCEWTEYESASEAMQDREREEMDESEALETLQEKTYVIEFNGGILVQEY